MSFTNSENYSDYIKYSTNCLKLILEERRREKSHSVQNINERSTVPLNENNQSSFENQTQECLLYLKSIDRKTLWDLIREVTNTTVKPFTSGYTGREEEFLFDDEWYSVSIWSIVFVSMVLFAIFGNSLIIWIIIREKVMRTVINIFLVNLTLSDLLTVSFNATFNFVFMLTGNWPFNYVYCVFNNFINNLTIASSVFTATVMSIDRYIAIVYPLKPRMTKKRAMVNITLIWLCAIFFASPTIVFSKTVTITYSKHNDRTLCLLEWPDGVSGVSKFDLAYNIAFLLLTYILPLIVMAVAYTLMARVLWDRRQNSLNSNVQKELIRTKQKCVRMLITVISIFGICWLPYHSYFLCTYFWPELIKIRHIKHIYLAIYWLAMANSLFDPVILFLMNKRFQQCLMHYIRCHCLTGRDVHLNKRVPVTATRLANTKHGQTNGRQDNTQIPITSRIESKRSIEYPTHV